MIKLNNISFKYDKELILDNFNLNVKTNEKIALVGMSGSGKSTILRIIAGLEKPQKGKVFIDSKDVGNIPTFQRNIGFLFQNYALFPFLNVKKNIEFGITKLNNQERAEKINNFAKLLGISKLLEKFPHELSGGEKQRVALARTLILEPKIILLDEPFSAIDTKLKNSIRNDLKAIFNNLNITLILVTHDIEDANVFCSRVINLDNSE